MLLSIISDTHDNIWSLQAAMPRLAETAAVIHCGDLCSPFMLRQLGEGMGGKPVHMVWGNNNGDILLIQSIASQLGSVTLHGELAELVLDGVRVAVNHYPGIARGLAASGKYDLVCFGHTHKTLVEKVGECLLLNPGELMGLYGQRTFALFDTATRQVEIVEVLQS
jgi:putative phosphoesterase